MKRYTVISEHEDRITYIEEKEGKLYGLNFMQGSGDYEFFERDGFAKNDEKLFKLAELLIDHPQFRHMSFLDKIDEIISMYLLTEETREQVKEETLQEVTKAWLDANEFEGSLDEIEDESLTIQDQKFKEYLLEQFNKL